MPDESKPLPGHSLAGQVATMTDGSGPEDSRRQFLGLGLRVVSGLAVSVAFNACDRNDEADHGDIPTQTFVSTLI